MGGRGRERESERASYVPDMSLQQAKRERCGGEGERVRESKLCLRHVLVASEERGGGGERESQSKLCPRHVLAASEEREGGGERERVRESKLCPRHVLAASEEREEVGGERERERVRESKLCPRHVLAASEEREEVGGGRGRERESERASYVPDMSLQQAKRGGGERERVRESKLCPRHVLAASEER